MKGFVAAALVVAFGLSASTALAGVTSVKAPKRVKAGKQATVTVRLDQNATCRLTAGKATASVPLANQIQFTFTVSPKAKPGKYTLTLRCGTESRKLKLTVTKGKGRRGTSKTLVRGKITTRASARIGGDVNPVPTPPCCKVTPTPTPTPTPDPSAPGPANSFRAVYALASDQAEKPGYVAGIVATIDEINRWFATQTTGNVQPRWIRDAGAPKVAVVKLARPASAYENPADGLASFRADLAAAAPLAAPTQKSVVWMDVVNPEGACGLTTAGISWMTERPCGIDPTLPAIWPSGATYITAHELAHNFGAVPDCAPHSIGGGHVGDDPGDLLYAGGGPRDWNNLSLDPGHDDYYATGNACSDIAKSVFWTKTASPDS